MWRGILGGIALAMLAAGAAVAGDKPAKAEAKATVGGAIQVQAQSQPGGEIRILVNGKEVQVPGGKNFVVVGEQQAVKGGEHYWLGVQIIAMSDELRAEKKLPKEGVVVGEVAPDSPAAKAGVKAHDVIVKAGKKALKEPHDLIAAVQESQGKPLALEAVRDGKKQAITVTPAPAPKRWGEGGLGIGGLGPMPGTPAGPQMFWRSFVMPEPGLPDDMTVTITKTGKKPAQIVVKQGDQKWEAGENDLGRLPEKVRPYAERMLGRWSPMPLPTMPFIGPGAPKGPALKIPDQLLRFQANPAIEKRLDEMSKRLDKLQSAVDELRKNQPRKHQPQEKKK